MCCWERHDISRPTPFDHSNDCTGECSQSFAYRRTKRASVSPLQHDSDQSIPSIPGFPPAQPPLGGPTGVISQLTSFGNEPFHMFCALVEADNQHILTKGITR